MNPPPEPKKIRFAFALANRNPAKHIDIKQIELLNRFAAPCLLAVEDKEAFWAHHHGNTLWNGDPPCIIPVSWNRSLGVTEFLTDHVRQWCSVDEFFETWVVLLGPTQQFGVRGQDEIAEFLQFVTDQPSTVHYVRSVIPIWRSYANPIIDVSNTPPVVVTEKYSDSVRNLFVVTDRMVAWRVSHVNPFQVNSDVVFWTHAPTPANE